MGGMDGLRRPKSRCTPTVFSLPFPQHDLNTAAPPQQILYNTLPALLSSSPPSGLAILVSLLRPSGRLPVC
jgi:hypothetical protein